MPFTRNRPRARTDTIRRARELRGQSPEGELLLWHYLRRRQLQGFRFRRQHPIGPYIADFACVNPRLVIEVDGSQHADSREYDEQRDAYLRAAGYRVVRCWTSDVFTNVESVLDRILCELRIAADTPHAHVHRDGKLLPLEGELPSG